MKKQYEIAGQLLEEYKKLIEELKESRTVDIYWSHGNKCFAISEMCDEYFSKRLSKEDCEELSGLFSKMAKFYDELNVYEKEKSYEEELLERKFKLKLEEEKNKLKPTFTIVKNFYFGGKLTKSVKKEVFDTLDFIDKELKSNGYILEEGTYKCKLDSGEIIEINLIEFVEVE